MAWLPPLFIGLLFTGCPFLPDKNQVHGSPIKGLFNFTRGVATSSPDLATTGLKDKRTLSDDFQAVAEDSGVRTNIGMLETIVMDLETGQWQKKAWGFDRDGHNYLTGDVLAKVWTDFSTDYSGDRATASREWLDYSQGMWDNTYTESGVAQLKNIGTYGLKTCTGPLLTNGRFAILAHLREGYGWDPDTGQTNNYISTMGRLQIEHYVEMVKQNRDKLDGAQFFVSRYGGRTATNKWNEMIRFLAAPLNIAPNSVDWVTHGVPHPNGRPVVSGDPGGKMLYSGEQKTLLTQGYSRERPAQLNVEAVIPPTPRQPPTYQNDDSRPGGSGSSWRGSSSSSSRPAGQGSRFGRPWWRL